MKLTKKKWDSNFFGYPIGELIINEKIEIPDEKLLLKNSKDFKLVYVILPDDVTLPYNCQGKLKLVDKKIVFKKNVQDSINVYDSKNKVESIMGFNPELCYDLSLQSGIYSRFKIDKNFRNGEFEKLYKAWIENSLKGEIADSVLSVLNEMGLPKGLVTIKSKNGVSNIGIIAVNKEYRGQGIGSSLLNAVEQFSIKRKNKTISVATQLDNKLACSFYIKNGFTMKSITNIYHLWNL